MVTCTGHIGIHEGADGRTDVRMYVRTLYVRTDVRCTYVRTFMTSWLENQIFSHRWVTIFS